MDHNWPHITGPITTRSGRMIKDFIHSRAALWLTLLCGKGWKQCFNYQQIFECF